jgi:hypothetical protein
LHLGRKFIPGHVVLLLGREFQQFFEVVFFYILTFGNLDVYIGTCLHSTLHCKWHHPANLFLTKCSYLCWYIHMYIHMNIHEQDWMRKFVFAELLCTQQLTYIHTYFYIDHFLKAGSTDIFTPVVLEGNVSLNVTI